MGLFSKGDRGVVSPVLLRKMDFSSLESCFAPLQIRLLFYCVVSIPAGLSTFREGTLPRTHRNGGCGTSHWDMKEEEPTGFTRRPGHKHTNAADDGGGDGKQQQNIRITSIQLFVHFAVFKNLFADDSFSSCM